jgi:methyl-accepting chemotaxis protein
LTENAKKKENRKKIVNRERKENSRKKERGQSVVGIKVKLIIGFAVPLICMIITGVVAYSLASSGMTENYEDSMSKAMSMAVQYLDFGFESAVSESEQLYYDTDLARWASGAIYNEWTKKEIAEDASVDLSVKQQGNEFVENMYIIPGDSLSVVSTYDNETEIAGFYNDLADKDEAACLETLKGNWVGTHSYIDEVLSGYYSGYSSDQYACSYIRPMTTKRACIVVDYSSEAIADVLKDLDLGDQGISAFITADGRELLMQGNEIVKNSDFSFVTQSYYTESMTDQAATIIDYITYQGQQYLFMLSKSYENGSAICAMVPVSMVNAGAASIQKVTAWMVIISCLIAILTCIYITIGIDSTIKNISKKLEGVSDGDLTVEMNTNRKDEFKLLVKSISDMIKNSRNLIVQVLNTTKNVSSSTSNLTEASQILTSSSDQIALAVDEMDRGLNQQAKDSQDCLQLMDALSERITLAVDTVKKMDQITGKTKDVIANGMSTMDELTKKSDDTTNITRNVTTDVRNLEESLSEVEKFVTTINGVAEETNLLALNASIEAARAGDAGKGFAVVAQSVSSLSDSTIEAASQIQGVMDQLKEYANNTVRVASKAEDIVSKQSETVKETIHVFRDMNGYLENLIKEITALRTAIESMEDHRNDTLSAIQSISSVSQQTAASISVVNDSLKNQVTMIGNLHNATMELDDRAKELTGAVNAFKL